MKAKYSSWAALIDQVVTPTLKNSAMDMATRKGFDAPNAIRHPVRHYHLDLNVCRMCVKSPGEVDGTHAQTPISRGTSE